SCSASLSSPPRRSSDLAGFHFVIEDALHGAVLAFEDLRRALEDMDGFVHACGFHHAAIERDVAVEHGQAAFLRVGMLDAANAARSEEHTSELQSRENLV